MALEITRPSGSGLLGPRACRPCAAAKAKCTFTVTSTGRLGEKICTRCMRLEKQCIMQVPATKRPRKSKTIRVAHLEGKLDSIVALMRTPGQQSSVTGPIRETSSLPVLNTPARAAVEPSSIYRTPGSFLGPTSFSAVFSENRGNFEFPHSASISNRDSPVELPQQAPQAQSLSSNSKSIIATTYEEEFSYDVVRLGMKVLSQIPSEEACRVLYSRHVNPNDGWVRLAGARLSASIWPCFGRFLHGSDSRGLEALSHLISRNTGTDIKDEGDTGEWYSSFSGENIRWEAVGILFTYWSFGALSSSDNDPLVGSNPNMSIEGRRNGKREIMKRFKECAANCIALCPTERGNPLLVYLLYKHSLLQTMVGSDASLTYWRQNGDLCSLTTALGMHCDTENPSGKVTIQSEVRRRIYTAVFNIDKVISTFTGRPPLLSYRFSSTPLPLDISDEDLLSDGGLEKIAEDLDKNGWNTKGIIYSTTTLRARNAFMVVRGEILEMALSHSPEGTASRILDLKQRSKTAYEHLPNIMKYHPDDLSDHSIPSWDLYSRLLTRLEHLQNLFLLERLLIKQGHATAQDLVDVSIEMLSLTSGIWKERERLMCVSGDFEWLIMYHAVPASGSLCVEILKRVKERSGSRHLRIPFSKVIQDLIMLNGFLDWVSPSAPNYELCRRIREIIGRVLEQVLESQPRASTHLLVDVNPGRVQDEGHGFELGCVTEFGAGFDFEEEANLKDFNDYATFDLLDTFEWCNESWINEDLER